jgi:tRNA(fMet)-specific endonuclease VapC
VPFLLDTNVIIEAHNGSEPVLKKLVEHDGEIVVSTLCLAELKRGLYADPELAERRRERLDVLLTRLPVWPFDVAAVAAYERIIASRGWVRGRDFDRMIAGHAISRNAVLVSDNISDFADIPGLMLENWSA